GMALAPAAARAQTPSVPINYMPPDPVIPLPLFHDRPERGGFFIAGDFIYFRQSMPITNQVIATRGLIDFDGSITRALTGQTINPITGGTLGPPFSLPGPLVPGTFIGSNAVALNAQDVLPNNAPTFVPGFSITGGWKFQNGCVLDVTWWHLQEAKYSAGAT